MSKCEKSVDFWVKELTKDTDPEHLDFEISDLCHNMSSDFGYGQWLWNCGYNAGLVNLQTKINTYCVPQWISVKDRLPEKSGNYIVCGTIRLWDIEKYRTNDRVVIARFTIRKEWLTSLSVKYWMPIPEPPESEDDAE